MKIQKKLSELLTYYVINRKVGHTKLLKDGIKSFEGKKFILASHKQDFSFLECKPEEVISLCNLESLRGHNIPMVIDNGAIIEILSEALTKIEDLEKENSQLLNRNQMILVSPKNKLLKKIEKLEIENGKLSAEVENYAFNKKIGQF